MSKIKTGTCIFCGQMINVNDEDIQTNKNKEEINKFATKQCSCDEAVDYKKRERQKENAKSRVKELFGEKVEDKQVDVNAVMFLKACIDAVACGCVGSISIGITGKTTASITMTKKGKIKVLRKDIESKAFEE